MKLPNGGNIVVVDDKYSEIEPLIEFFGRYGVSVNYFKGPQGVFPEIPLVGVRLVFLDLAFSSSFDSKTIIGNAANILKNILDSNNGPFLLFTWSTRATENTEELEKFLQTFENGNYRPESIIPLPKTDYFITESDSSADVLTTIIEEDTDLDDVDKERIKKNILIKFNNDFGETKKIFDSSKMPDLVSKIELELHNAGLISLFVDWENCVRNAVPKITDGLYKIVTEYTDDNSDRLQAMVNSLSKKHLEKNYTDDTSVTEKVDASINELNEMFSFFYEEETKTISDDNIEIFPGNDNAFEDKKAELNTWKMIRNSSRANLPGKIFIDKEKKCKFLSIFDLSNQKKSIQEFLDAIRDEEGVKEFVTDLDQKGSLTFVEINVSGECETAQNKLPVTKLIPGVIIDEEIYSEWKKTGELKKPTPSYINDGLGPFLYNNKVCRFIFNVAQTTYIENSQVAELQEVFDISRPYYLQIRKGQIRYFGEAIRVALVKRGSIKEIPVRRNNSDELYYRITVREWLDITDTNESGKAILPKESGFVSEFTNMFLLEHSEYVQELLIKSEEEFRLYSELKRTAKTADVEGDDSLTRFRSQGCQFVFSDGEIIVIRVEDGKIITKKSISEFGRRPSQIFRQIQHEIGK